jgi:hypothetical protein
LETVNSSILALNSKHNELEHSYQGQLLDLSESLKIANDQIADLNSNNNEEKLGILGNELVAT